jgi:hypothetical protein
METQLLEQLLFSKVASTTNWLSLTNLQVQVNSVKVKKISKRSFKSMADIVYLASFINY